MVEFRIIIERRRKPTGNQINQELQWIGYSLGLFNERDRDKSCFRIFIELLQATKRKTTTSSDDLAHRLNLTRGTIVHHLNKLIETRLVIHEKNKYVLRAETLTGLIDGLEQETKETLEEIKKIAEEIEKKL